MIEFEDYGDAKAWLEIQDEDGLDIVFTDERINTWDGPASVCAMKRDGNVIKVIVTDNFLNCLDERARAH